MQAEILAFGTHPDDVELFCGGTLIKMQRMGHNVVVVDLTRGELATRGTPEVRRREAEEAAKILQAKQRVFLDIEDAKLENTEANRLKIIREIRRWKPLLVFLPFGRDRHPDHEHAHRLIRDAAFYAGLNKIETKEQAHRPKAMIQYFSHYVEKPSFIVDISDTYDYKIDAMRAYRSQLYNPDSDEPQTYVSSEQFWRSIEVRARYFGHQIGATYGEPFYSPSMLKINNLVEQFS